MSPRVFAEKMRKELIRRDGPGYSDYWQVADGPRGSVLLIGNPMHVLYSFQSVDKIPNAFKEMMPVAIIKRSSINYVTVTWPWAEVKKESVRKRNGYFTGQDTDEVRSAVDGTLQFMQAICAK